MINSEMTKDEALELMCQEFGIGIDRRFAEQWISTWEKLGIVKFKSESVLEKLAKDPELAKRREEFRQYLADAEMPEHTLHSSPVLKAFDKVHGLRK